MLASSSQSKSGAFTDSLLRIRETAPLLGVLIVVAVVGALSNGNLLSEQNLIGTTNLTAAVGTVAIGVTVLMMAGEFDLSVSAIFAFTPIFYAKLTLESGWNEYLALIAALIVTALVGLANGLITTRLGIPSFITTLGILLLFTGINYVWTNGASLSAYADKSAVLSVLGGQLGKSALFMPFIWMMIWGLLAWYAMTRMKLGNWTLSAGGRLGAARAMGVPVTRVKTRAFVLCSLLAGFSGLSQFGQLRIVSSGYGQDYNLLAIVAAVVGGASLFGVVGSIPGALLGAFLLGVLETGLILIGAPGAWYQSFIGVILLISVVLNTALDRVRVKRGAL